MGVLDPLCRFLLRSRRARLGLLPASSSCAVGKGNDNGGVGSGHDFYERFLPYLLGPESSCASIANICETNQIRKDTLQKSPIVLLL